MSVSLPIGTKFFVYIDNKFVECVIKETDNMDCIGCFLDDDDPDAYEKKEICESIDCVDAVRHDKVNIKVVKLNKRR